MSKRSIRPQITTEPPRLPQRPAGFHKGQAGRVAIIAGSRGMSGAAVLCGLGALRGGAGLVRVLTPASVQPIVAAGEPCLMTTPLAEDKLGRIAWKQARAELLRAIEWADAIAIGPGLGLTGPELPRSRTFALVDLVWNAARVPLVLDADALNAIASLGKERARGWWHCARKAAMRPRSPIGRPPAIITPHPGEMQRLRAALGLPEVDLAENRASRLAAAHEFACLTNTTVVLKGHSTVVCTPRSAYINATGNPGMATGGMGDVLTGLIAALLGQGLDCFAAAQLAVHAHGAAGDACARGIGRVGFLAREVADRLPQELSHLAVTRRR